MPSDEICNDELMRRLKSHNYAVPPITHSTRGVLLKKLAQLDAEKRQKGRVSKVTNGQATKRGVGALLDYSSGEEDVTLSPSVSTVTRRRTSNSSRNAAPPVNGRTNGHVVAAHVPVAFSGGRLMNYSENEEEEDEEDDEMDDDAVEEEEEEEDEEEGEEDDDEPEQLFRQRHLGVETSPRLDNTSIIDGRLNGTDGVGIPTPKSASRFGLQFKSSTPLHFVPTTSHVQQPIKTSTPNIETNSGVAASPLRRAIAQNEKAFGSLGEALDSLPSRSSASKTGNGNNSKPDVAKTTSKESKTEYLNKNSGFCNSHAISKLIIPLFGFFFIVLFYKYATLRPHIDIRHRLPICPPGMNNKANGFFPPCVPADQVEEAADLYKSLVSLLQNFQKCQVTFDDDVIDESAKIEDGDGAVSLSLVKSVLLPEADSVNPDDEFERDLAGKMTQEDLLKRLVKIMEDNSEFGVRVLTGNDVESTELSLLQPRVQWTCWIIQKIHLAFHFGTMLTWWAILSGGLLIFSYLVYKVYKWQQERVLTEKQDVFELVEQVLSLLVNQHQAAMRGGVVARPYLAINHIRDQLIAPQDRKRKKRLWNKVVEYIQESESRVREEVQVVYGEENRVWRWIPDMNWSTTINPHGPNPYVSPTSSPGFPPPPVPPFITPQNVSPPSPVTPWQGSAFSSLNKSVAAPPVAPTSCLKVRHMFDKQAMSARHPNLTGSSNTNAWVWQVKEEILQRCSSGNGAQILHIAVDTESSEGCVYIKARNTEEAAKVFTTLHGQWYGGNLVTVKYMREERYHSRFPDSRNQTKSLTPVTKFKPLS